MTSIYDFKAIQNNRIDQFKQYMSTMDLLLVDDIQFLAGKEKSHEIFFSIYNELVNNRKHREFPAVVLICHSGGNNEFSTVHHI